MEWAEFAALPRRTVPVDGNRLSVIDVGHGPTLMLLHGNPTWSYQWRDLLPTLSARFRVLAPDLPGFGCSDPVADGYTWETHWTAVDTLTATAGPSVVVGHDWGGALAAYLAVERPERVRGLVLMEPQLLPETWDDYEGARRERFQALRDPDRNVALVQDRNLMVEQIPDGVMRELSAEEMDAYRRPFPSPQDRVPIRRFVEMKPIGEDAETADVFRRIQAGLPGVTVPVLLLTVRPGAIMRPPMLARVRRLVRQVEVGDLGPGGHHFHEDYPGEVCQAILDFSARHGLDRR